VAAGAAASPGPGPSRRAGSTVTIGRSVASSRSPRAPGHRLLRLDQGPRSDSPAGSPNSARMPEKVRVAVPGRWSGLCRHDTTLARPRPVRQVRRCRFNHLGLITSGGYPEVVAGSRSVRRAGPVVRPVQGGAGNPCGGVSGGSSSALGYDDRRRGCRTWAAGRVAGCPAVACRAAAGPAWGGGIGSRHATSTVVWSGCSITRPTRSR